MIMWVEVLKLGFNLELYNVPDWNVLHLFGLVILHNQRICSSDVNDVQKTAFPHFSDEPETNFGLRGVLVYFFDQAAKLNGGYCASGVAMYHLGYKIQLVPIKNRTSIILYDNNRKTCILNSGKRQLLGSGFHKLPCLYYIVHLLYRM